jgi:hypothetical protein
MVASENWGSLRKNVSFLQKAGKFFALYFGCNFFKMVYYLKSKNYLLGSIKIKI